MLGFFRRLSSSKVGTAVLLLFLAIMAASFAVADIGNVRSSFGGGGAPSDIARIAGQSVTEQDLAQTQQIALRSIRQQKPDATYADLDPMFDEIVRATVDDRALALFAEKSGFILSKRLIDSEIASLPAAKGLDGKFSEQAYQALLQQQNMTDAQFRRMVRASLLQQLIVNPAAAGAQLPIKVSTGYASMLLEMREGDVGVVPVEAFLGNNRPSDADLNRYYAANRLRYVRPETRVLRVATMAAPTVAAPTEAEIAAYYEKNKARYAGVERRVLSQAVVPDKAVAEGIAARARAGASFAEAAKPAGLTAADVSLGPVERAAFAASAGEAVANPVFTASAGAVIGPIQSDLGWRVIKVDSIAPASGRTLAQARGDIATALQRERAATALADRTAELDDAIADGAGFADVVKQFGLSVSETPPLLASGMSPTQPAYRLPATLQAALKGGFDLEADDKPLVEALPDNQGALVVTTGAIVPAAPAPLAEIRDRVAADWARQAALDKARALANAVAQKVQGGMSIADALKGAGVPLPPAQKIAARRIQISQAPPQAQAALQMLFSLPAGKSRLVADPQGNGFYIVKTGRVMPGDASGDPTLIGRLRGDFANDLSNELAQQMLGAVRQRMGATINAANVAAARARLKATN